MFVTVAVAVSGTITSGLDAPGASVYGRLFKIVPRWSSTRSWSSKVTVPVFVAWKQ